MSNDGILLLIKDLTVSLPDWADRPAAVRSASLDLRRNEILCIIGESGSGKSVLSRAVMGLLPEPHVRATGGSITFDGRDLLKISKAERRQISGPQIGMVFQEPMTSLNPLMTVGRQIDELIERHSNLSAKERRAKIIDMMEEVRLPDPVRVFASYPHQLSGGQRQRVMIVMAMVLGPRVLIADEPTTALDVTTQAQILTLIRQMQKTHGTGVLFITHDFGVVAEIADRVAVMCKGELVEVGPVEKILRSPDHPYTRSLIAAVPSLTPPAPRAEVSAVSVSKSYRKAGSMFRRAPVVKPALDNVSLDVRKGEIVGLVGESGSASRRSRAALFA